MNIAITGRDFIKIIGAAAVALCCMAAATSKAEARPNILFIVTDQQFGDAMSCRMGQEYIHTPALDSLAETGTLFTRAYTPNPLCMPAPGNNRGESDIHGSNPVPTIYTLRPQSRTRGPDCQNTQGPAALWLAGTRSREPHHRQLPGASLKGGSSDSSCRAWLFA